MTGIYIHIPFCDTKCIYCDFYSITNHALRKDFIEGLLKEIGHNSNHTELINTIFFGGGTPSLLSADEFKLIFDSLYKYFNISTDAEITIEANPGTIDNHKLTEFNRLPINRISFGIQSFNNDDLKFLSRIHTSEEAEYSVISAKESGFDNINIDLIFSIPGQSIKTWESNLKKATELDINHISAYSLIFEEGTYLNTLLNNGTLKRNETELERQLLDITADTLVRNGYNHYEISNYSKPGYECRHNLTYWQYNEYYGFGPSAASFINGVRKTNVKNLKSYIEQINNNGKAYDMEENISYNTALKEYIFLGLRSKGINNSDFKKRFNLDFTDKYNTLVDQLIKNNYAYIDNETFRLSEEGYAICDEISIAFF